eukprot:sb/3468048/
MRFILNVIITPEKLMEELLPKLNVVELEQNLRMQNYGALDCGPPVSKTCFFNSKNSTLLIIIYSNSSGYFSHQTTNMIIVQREGERVSERKNSERIEREREQGADTPAVLRNREPTAGDSPPHTADHLTDTQPNNEMEEEEGAMSCEETWDNNTSSKSEVGEIQLAYTFCSDSMCYGKVLPGPTITLRQFKEVVSWASCDDSTRYFFKSQIPGFGEIHNEVTDDSAILPFWSQNTVVGRVILGMRCNPLFCTAAPHRNEGIEANAARAFGLSAA